MNDIRQQVEQSSLGTTQARAMRHTVSAACAAAVIDRAAALTRPVVADRAPGTKWIRSKKSGG